MNPEERKKFIEKCRQASELAERAVLECYGNNLVHPDFHPAYKKIFEKALEKIMNEP
jgi:hypothetical protein